MLRLADGDAEELALGEGLGTVGETEGLAVALALAARVGEGLGVALADTVEAGVALGETLALSEGDCCEGDGEGDEAETGVAPDTVMLDQRKAPPEDPPKPMIAPQNCALLSAAAGSALDVIFGLRAVLTEEVSCAEEEKLDVALPVDEYTKYSVEGPVVLLSTFVTVTVMPLQPTVEVQKT